jgi:tetratricopeptide (TPR) repeat protein
MVFHMLRAQLGDTRFFSLLHDFLTQFSGKAATIADFERMAQARAAGNAAPADPAGFVLRGDSAPPPPPAAEALNLRPFFAQWIDSTGVPEFTLTYTVYRIKTGFKLIGKVRQNLDFFRMPVEVEIQTEGNPEYKTIQVTGTETSFDLDVFGRPKSNGITLDPHNFILKSSPRLRVRGVIARGEALAELGRYYDAVQQYNQALDIEKGNALATFRIGEAFFYQKNYSAAANAFRDAMDSDLDLNTKWVEVWSHVYLGKIYDISGDRARAVNEYSKAEQTNDNTGGAQDEVKKYLAQAYSDQPASAAPAAAATPAAPAAPAPVISEPPVLQRRE